MPLSLQAHDFRIFYSKEDDPLTSFYIPALSASIRYDRSAGFFSSTALAVAAAGVARLIQNGGRMRLLVGAELSQEDVDAIRQGYDLKDCVSKKMLSRFADPEDQLLRDRLSVMAWMVAEGTLDIRVVLPRDEHGLPIPAHLSSDYYHPKQGIFTDAAGDRVAFVGSVNESETAWKKNFENFSVYFSWNDTHPYLAQVSINFEKLWDGREPDWIALEIPRAVTEKLLQYKPAKAPGNDPFEKPEEPVTVELPVSPETLQKERLLFQFLRDAPHLTNASGLGAATSAILPWPHQSRVADEVIRDFPEPAMFCDEVGLGKTIEAGLVLRQLLLSGRVRRCLILAPKSVLKQWQEELYEKFNLDIPRYDGGQFWNVGDKSISWSSSNPWDAFPVMLAGSQLAKRAERRAQILSAQGWDLLLVDEAHHARRKDFKEDIYRPNRLLGLINDINERGLAASLLLMTATPMQVHPVEVWDLLKTLGLGGRWGSDKENFLVFFTELRKPFPGTDWDFVFDMVGDYLDTGGELDVSFQNQVQREVNAVEWSMLEGLPHQHGSRSQTLKQLGERAQPYIKELAHLHTPLRRFIFRNTRSLLRDYVKKGILKANVPTRWPAIVRVAMTPEEYDLYRRIEEYITHFYQKYEDERRGLGFVMTVYRRRLTSSFYAVRCSLERRLKFLKGEQPAEKTFTEDDTEQEDLNQDAFDEEPGADDRAKFQGEIAYLRDYIQALKAMGPGDSKLETLKGELSKVFLQRTKVLVFTQYTDTMDYLRDQLVEVYGREVACYSGRGGEVWNGIAWVVTTKEKVKADFRDGEIRILVCTESASEGLNLQTCGVLINYDMPWNPMRVEQRIGRIDRIGQDYKEVWISNYFYEDTIEDKVYQSLSDRIQWFEVVVGDLQPILAEVGEATRRLAMVPGQQREAQLQKEISALVERLNNRQLEGFDLDHYVISGDYQPTQPSPISLADIETLLTQSAQTSSHFTLHPEISGAYRMHWREESIPVTFSPAVFDEHPDTVRFLSYGSPLLDELLVSIPEPEDAPIVRLQAHEDGVDLRGWYYPKYGRAIRIEHFAHLKAVLNEEIEQLTDEIQTAAEQSFQQEVATIEAHDAAVLEHRRKAAWLAERARAQRLLVKAALVELALGQQPSLFDADKYPQLFSEEAIRGLQRYRYPWGPLVKLAYEDDLRLSEEDPYFVQIKGSSVESLKSRFAQLTDEAKRTVNALSKASQG